LGTLKGNPTQKNTFAIKQLRKADVHKKKLIDNLKLEKDILKVSRSNFITRLRFAFRDDDYYYLAMELARGGDLYSFLKAGSQRRKLFRAAGEDAIRFILGSLILSLEYLHSKDIVYFDLKPENILVFEDGYVKLADFGLARRMVYNENDYYRAGTKMYFPPEVIIGGECKRYVDLWTLGVIAYELCNMCLPFHSDDIGDSKRFSQAVLAAESNRKWCKDNISEDLKDFINRLLKLEPRVRMGSSGWKRVKVHNFFKNADFDW
jgi:serine/threonine protein kinase